VSVSVVGDGDGDGDGIPAEVAGRASEADCVSIWRSHACGDADAVVPDEIVAVAVAVADNAHDHVRMVLVEISLICLGL
jgi:hypothetical protein